MKPPLMTYQGNSALLLLGVFARAGQLLFIPGFLFALCLLLIRGTNEQMIIWYGLPMVLCFMPKNRKTLLTCLADIVTGVKCPFRRKRHFAIYEDGIEDYASPIPSGFIPRTNIVEVKRIKVNGLESAIGVFLAEPERLIQDHGTIAQWYLRRVYNAFGTPVVLHPTAIGLTHHHLESLLTLLTHERPQPYAPRQEYLVPYIENPAVTRHDP